MRIFVYNNAMDLKTLRKKKGLTQEEAADAVGLSRRGYQNLESGVYKKKDTKTIRYALAVLDSLPDPNAKKRALSLTNIGRALETLLEDEEVRFVYLVKSGSQYRFVLDTDMDDLNLYGLEEELGANLGVELTFERFSSLIKRQGDASDFFAQARRIYPL